MRVLALSDTHNNEVPGKRLPDCDVLIHAGDATGTGSEKEVIRFLEWYGKTRAHHRLFVPGNHDFLFQTHPERAYELCADHDVQLLIDDERTIDGKKFYGSPWQPEYCDWAFNLPRDGKELSDKWKAIPWDTEVLITHGPPKHILDPSPIPYCNHTENHGCEILFDRVREMSYNRLRAHVFGHMHTGYGIMQRFGVMFVNAATCNEDYRPWNAPILLHL